jgi:SAM-dependent methyltransferase
MADIESPSVSRSVLLSPDQAGVTEHEIYFKYLLGRSRLGHMYRRWLLYPRLTGRLQGRCLDIGCGIGDMLAFRSNTEGVDVNPLNVAYCKSLGLEARVMDIDVLPHASGNFDSVLLDNVLEHIEAPKPLLMEVRRVLRRGGRFVVGVPGSKGFASDPDHKIEYNEASLRACIEPAGFKHVETMHSPLWASTWLSQRVRQYCIYMSFEAQG